MRSLRLATARLAAALALGLTLAPAPALGAEPDANAQAASKHFHRGVELSEEGDWRAALIEFQRAYDIDPNFRVLYDIGQCRYQLHDYPGALTAFQKYLADGLELVPPERRATVDSDINSLKGRVAFVRISTRESGAEVSVDDEAVGATPLASPVVVSAGRHKIIASLAGSPGVVRYVDVAGEETLDVTLDLGSLAGGAPLRTSNPPTTRRPSLAPALVAFGVAAVGVGVGSYLGIQAIDDKRTLDGQCVAGSCPESSKSIYNDAQRNALWSTVGFGAAILGAGAGAAYLIFWSPRESARTPSASLRLVIGPGSIQTSGTF